MHSIVRLISVCATIVLSACASRPAAPVIDPATAIDIDLINESRGHLFIFNTFDDDRDCRGQRVHVPLTDKFERTSFRLDRRAHVTFYYGYLQGVAVSHTCDGSYTFPAEQRGRYQIRTVRYEKTCRVSVTKVDPRGNTPVELVHRPYRVPLIESSPRCVADERF